MAKVGIMHSGSQESGQKECDVLIERLKQKYAKSLMIDGPHYPDDKYSLENIAANLMSKNVDILIATGGSRSAHAAMQNRGRAKKLIIVFTSVAPYIVDEIQDSTTVTGVCAHTSDYDGTRLEKLLQHAFPGQTPTIGVLRNSNRGDHASQWQKIKDAANGKCTLSDGDINGPLTIKKAFEKFKNESVQGLLVAADPFLFENGKEVVEKANQENYPAIYQWREFVDKWNGYMSYGPNRYNLYAQAGTMVAEIAYTGSVPPVWQVQEKDFELVLHGS
jgi:ABC-type uncharacterized transport system substrate-binding protein